MKYLDGIKYCLSKIGAKEDFIFNDKIQVFTVGGKQFCRVYDIEGKKSFALKADVELNIILRQKYNGILVPQNMHNCYWNLVLLEDDVPENEIVFLIDLSYDLMFNSLTKKIQKQLIDKSLGL